MRETHSLVETEKHVNHLPIYENAHKRISKSKASNL